MAGSTGPSPRTIATAFLAAMFAYMLYGPVALRMHVLGIGRALGLAQMDECGPFEVERLAGTAFTEDLHLHAPSGLLFGASEALGRERRDWFPPMARFEGHDKIGQGTIVVIDSKTLSVQRLTLEDFEGPFSTHGIDVYSTAEEPETVYILAVNHAPNAEHYSVATARTWFSLFSPAAPKARSRLELFRHRIGSSTATHVRSIWHPLIRTPNDVLIASPTGVFVTNDHYARDGWLRVWEHVMWELAEWTDLIHLELQDALENQAKVLDDAVGVIGTVAHRGWHSNNGLGHGRKPSEMIVTRAHSGEIIVANITTSSTSLPETAAPLLTVTDRVRFEGTLDNPNYFHDPYAVSTGRDASGIVVAGLSHGYKFPGGVGGTGGGTLESRNPAVVWLMSPSGDGGWGEKRVIFRDDGREISTSSTAVLIALDPSENGGRKRARLFVTGPTTGAVIVTTIDL